MSISKTKFVELYGVDLAMYYLLLKQKMEVGHNPDSHQQEVMNRTLQALTHEIGKRIPEGTGLTTDQWATIISPFSQQSGWEDG